LLIEVLNATVVLINLTAVVDPPSINSPPPNDPLAVVRFPETVVFRKITSVTREPT
jgi:hypothetical protein